ncbi:hypothetical protein Psuf_056280 [Phytohabitans suffuscus]|uniref:Peptidase S8/S53 domain-containing protein n=1 Tax=Phytohabitans suffuscus TaxID=624315 RepID=A0A6F8YQ58_9ACTN|nr:hypothetical protein Psuf_056280 [Phytohabitans suffuscus]
MDGTGKGVRVVAESVRPRALAALAAASLTCTALSLAPGAPAAAARVACGPAVANPLVEAPWPLARLRPDLAWPLSTGQGVRVAVVDSGVSADHATLRGKVRPGRDFLSPDGEGDCDENGHGTLIAGIIAGREHTSAGFRFHGVAPDATVVPVRVLRDQRRSFEPDLSDRIAEAIRWAVDVGDAGVVNLSLTTPHTDELEAAVRHALDRGVVVVAAAGNQNETDDSVQQGRSGVFPAGYDGVIAVAGVDQDGAHVRSSIAGAHVDVAAPGARIAGPAPAGGGYLFTEEGGTSFAAGYVSGLAALIRAREPALRPDGVARRITETADHPAGRWNEEVGYGVVDPARAVGALRGDRGVPAVRARGVPPPATRPDPLADVTRVAVPLAVAGAAAALLVLAGVPVVRRGRRRGWRAGDRVDD